MADKPSKGLADIIAASTALSDIDGRAGLLFYRGYDIHQLAESATFEEIAYLLQRGQPPTSAELASYADDIAAGSALGSLVTACLPDVAGRQSPMEAMRSLVSLASADDPDKDSNAAGANIRKAARLVAQQPLLVASYHAARNGARSAPPSRSSGSPPTSCCRCAVRRRPRVRQRSSTLSRTACRPHDERLHVRRLGLCRHPVRHAFSGGRGDRHPQEAAAWRANEQVMYTLMDIRKSAPDDPVDMVECAVRDRLARGEKIMGFGHRVYKTEDPRATHLRQMSEELARASGDDTYYRMSRRMEKTVLAEKGLYPTWISSPPPSTTTFRSPPTCSPPCSR